MHRALKAVIAVNLVAVVVIAMILIYALVLETPWLSYKNLPFPTLVQEVRRGEVIPLQVVRCSSLSYRDSYTITHTLVNLDTGETYMLPATTLDVDPGCSQPRTSLLNKIPLLDKDGSKVKLGRYMVRGIAKIDGYVRTYRVEWYSEPFNVID